MTEAMERAVLDRGARVRGQVHLEDMLAASTADVDREVADAIGRLAAAAIEISAVIGDGALMGPLDAEFDGPPHREQQCALDVWADRVFTHALRSAPVAVLGSEEHADAIALNEGAPLAVTLDPLEGAANIDANVAMGSVFSILPTSAAANGTADGALLQAGTMQLAAGFVIYGPQTCLVLTWRRGTHIFTLDRRVSRFVLTERDVRIPDHRPEYAIDAANYRHWDEAIRTYVDDLVAGVDGPRGMDFSMRWTASLVAEAFRILQRGGIFLYPADRRMGFGQGRLRLVYEAQPLALVLEQAGGGAVDGFNRILDLVPGHLHQRTPLIFGSADKVSRVTRYFLGPPSTSERSPLFGRRGLFYHP